MSARVGRRRDWFLNSGSRRDVGPVRHTPSPRNAWGDNPVLRSVPRKARIPEQRGAVGLNRGGNRDANRALHVICVVRLRRHQPTRDYLARRIGEGRTRAEIMRCIKRYIAREIYYAVRPTRQEIPTQTLATT